MVLLWGLFIFTFGFLLKGLMAIFFSGGLGRILGLFGAHIIANRLSQHGPFLFVIFHFPTFCIDTSVLAPVEDLLTVGFFAAWARDLLPREGGFGVWPVEEDDDV